MTAIVMDGKALAEKVRAKIAEDVAALGGLDLATVLVGDDPASHIYIDLKHKAATAAGVHAVDVRMPGATSEADLLAKLDELNNDDSVDAILVQLPGPDHISEDKVICAVAPEKDVDCFHPSNVGELTLGSALLIPATALGVMEILAEYNVPLAGAEAEGGG